MSFLAHHSVLAQSPVLGRMAISAYDLEGGQVRSIKLSDFGPYSFGNVIEYLYSRDLLVQVSGSLIAHLCKIYIIAAKLKLDDLKSLVLTILTSGSNFQENSTDFFTYSLLVYHADAADEQFRGVDQETALLAAQAGDGFDEEIADMVRVGGKFATNVTRALMKASKTKLLQPNLECNRQCRIQDIAHLTEEHRKTEELKAELEDGLGDLAIAEDKIENLQEYKHGLLKVFEEAVQEKGELERRLDSATAQTSANRKELEQKEKDLGCVQTRYIGALSETTKLKNEAAVAMQEAELHRLSAEQLAEELQMQNTERPLWSRSRSIDYAYSAEERRS